MSAQRVFFDAVGTLIYADPPVFSVYHSMGQKYGSSLTTDDIAGRFSQAYHDHFSKQRSADLRSSESLEKQRWQAVVEQIFVDVTQHNAALFDDLWTHFSLAHHWNVYADNLDVLEQLLEAGVYVGIASNFDARLVNICQKLFPDIATDRIFYSTKLGYAKPDQQFYTSIANNFTPRSEFTMVGDDYENDIEAALEAGWNAIHRNNAAALLDIIPEP
jgi:REG-2-like HAD superfamily hydrolase